MRRRFWTEAEIEKLRNIYPHVKTSSVAWFLHRKTTAIYRMAAKLDIHKTVEFLTSDESGQLHKGGPPRSVVTQFKKGMIPHNKGKKMPGWGPGRMKETQFKPGHIPARKFPIGTIRSDRDGYLRIKVREAKKGEPSGFGNDKAWPLYNRYLWEQHKGPIPPGHMVVFKDKNRSHCEIDNLELISFAENVIRNRWGIPHELIEVVQLQSELKQEIRRLRGKKQDQRSAGPSVRNPGGAQRFREAYGPGSSKSDLRRLANDR
jgi:hypothetical protein